MCGSILYCPPISPVGNPQKINIGCITFVCEVFQSRDALSPETVPGTEPLRGCPWLSVNTPRSMWTGYENSLDEEFLNYWLPKNCLLHLFIIHVVWLVP